MIKIIQTGQVPKKIKRFTCSTCNCVFEADEDEVFTGQKNEPTVKCPCCESYIDWNSVDEYKLH